CVCFFFSSRRRHTRLSGDWSSDVCSSDLEDTHALVSKLKSKNPNEVLIVSSIQKMSNIKNEDGGLNAHDIELINKKRIVIIVDEAHRSTFGEMLMTIKETFPQAVFFGFTGTPIQEET